MRSVRYSKTFNDQLVDLIAMGEERFGQRVAESKKRLLFQTISKFLIEYPDIKRPNPVLGLVAYPINNTPFIVVYDFDDHELRMHFVFLAGIELSDIEPSRIEW